MKNRRASRVRNGFLELECRACLRWKVATQFRLLRLVQLDQEGALRGEIGSTSTYKKPIKVRSKYCEPCEATK